MDLKKVRGRGKRFLAGFLAMLLVVTLLPFNTADVAYAEELDVIVTETPDSVAAVDEGIEADIAAADKEAQASDSVVAADEGIQAGYSVVAVDEVTASDEDVLAPAEVNAATDISAVNTDGYEEKTNQKIRTWTFSAEYWESKGISNGTDLKDKNLDGITINSNSADGTVKAKDTTTSNNKKEEALSLDDGGIIDIPIDVDTDAVLIEIKLVSNNKARWINIGTGKKQETVYHSYGFDSDYAYVDGNPYFKKVNDVSTYVNSELYKKTDGMFSTVLSIKGNVGETKIGSIVLKEFTQIGKPVDLNNAAVELSTGKDTEKAHTAVYTGKPFNLDVLDLSVTIGGDTEVNPEKYTTSFLRESATAGVYEPTEDLTSAGKIKVKIMSIDENESDRTTAESNVFEITPAALEVSNMELPIDSEKIADYTSAQLDVAALIKPLSDSDNFTYSLDYTHEDFVKGEVVNIDSTGQSPSITSDGRLTYSISSTATASSAATVLVVKVESKNYETAYIKITAAIEVKPKVTISGTSIKHTYNGEPYGFKEKAVIAVTQEDDVPITDGSTLTDIKNNLSYTFTKIVDGTPVAAPETSEPVEAGTYKVTVKLPDNSKYSVKDYIDSENNGYVTLTIESKTVTIKPNDATWDKLLKAHPASKSSGAVTADDYTFVNGIGLVAGESMTSQPEIKYYKHDTMEEMTDDDWAVLENGDVVDIAAINADAGSNYNIQCAKGTLTFG